MPSLCASCSATDIVGTPLFGGADPAVVGEVDPGGGADAPVVGEVDPGGGADAPAVVGEGGTA